MAEFLTFDTDITAVANAIRAKGGTSAQLVYPNGFVSAIQAIQTGITPKLVVTTTPGAAITATPAEGFKIVKGTADTNGTCTLELPKAGTWDVTAMANGVSNRQRIVIGTQSMLLPLYHDTFADNTWAEIIAVCKTGVIPDSWAVGDSKPMAINGTNYQIDIIGKNHDVYADGSGTAPLTFQLHDCYAYTNQMNSSGTNSGGWASCAMRQVYLPSILLRMPAEVQSGIRAVSKNATTGDKSTTIETVSDKLFLLSEIEVFNTTKYSAAGEGTQYDYYKNGGAKIKKTESTAILWWERSPDLTRYDTFCGVNASGYATTAGANTQNGISFAFCF